MVCSSAPLDEFLDCLAVAAKAVFLPENTKIAFICTAVNATTASLLPWADASTPLLELIAQLQALTVSSNLENKLLLSAVKSVKDSIAVLEFPVETDIEPTCPTSSIIAPAPKPTPTQPAPTQALSSVLPTSVTK
ncbi:hypothetical protein DSO57_1023643 [Entomophthora muscae]|uniref:Uncharacterized protein n=1 Tax=Entomophthora muscae TaxID=34485 RepID=A0ACC2RHF2_9FUNG|nr:hypothetical protein DSO57_1023643 [Entomophthora muscae]